jgi:hypothetical protein
MAPDSPADDWLNPGFVECPSCHVRLYRVDHSPLYDEHWIYCTTCPRHVELGFYDQVVSKLPRDDTRWSHIERLLKPCTCGGTFAFAAPRRCPTCSCVVLDGASNTDLFPEVFGVLALGPDQEPSEQQAAELEAWERHCVRSEDLW